MTKKILFPILQFLLFLVLFGVGSFLHPFNLHWATRTAPSGATSFFIPDGLLLAVGLFLAIVIVQAIRKRSCATRWTVIAFVLAVGAGYAIRLGFITRDY
jgi:hypothetical protein